jgi:hypothetical protein
MAFILWNSTLYDWGGSALERLILESTRKSQKMPQKLKVTKKTPRL